MPRQKPLIPSSRLHQCNVCDKKFDRNETRERHEQEVHHKGQRIKCQTCEKTFSRLEYLRRHNCQNTTSDEKGRDDFICDVCDKIFTRNDKLQEHSAQVHGGVRYRCFQCAASYSQKYKLTKHLETKHHVNPNTSSHSRQKKRSCTQTNQDKGCHSRSDVGQESLNSSTTTDTKEGIEEVKGRQTRSRKRRQMRKEANHPSSMPSSSSGLSLTCNICRKQFSKPANLNRHIANVHEDMKNHICPKCPTGFTRRDIMERHVSEVHLTSKKFVCNDCPQIFTRSETLQRHISDVHKKVKLFSCFKCPEQFARRENLERHIKRGEHTPVINCEFCKKDAPFRSYNSYEKHFVKDHLGKRTCVTELQKRKYSYTCQGCHKIFTFKSIHDQYDFQEKFLHTFPDPRGGRNGRRMEACIDSIGKFLSYRCKYCQESFSFQSTSEVLEHFDKHYAVQTCYQTSYNITQEKRIKKGLSALREDTHTTCVGQIKRSELEFKKYPQRYGTNPCCHLECTRVTTKIIHPTYTEYLCGDIWWGEISLVSN